MSGQLIFASISGCQAEVQSNHFFAGTTYIIRFVLKLEQNKTVLLSVCLSQNQGFMRGDVLDKKGLGRFLSVHVSFLRSCSRINSRLTLKKTSCQPVEQNLCS